MKQDHMPRKAIIFARVSTKDQEEQGHSLPAQGLRLKDYAERNNFEVIKEFSFSESAGSKIRKKFEEVLAFLKRHEPNEMPVLLCQNVDRLTRNFRDAVDLDDMRKHQGLEIHFVQDGFFINADASGSQMFMWEAKVFIGKQYLNRLRDDAKRSIKHKLEKGEAVGKAPIGYLNVRDDSGKATVILDPERFMLVRRIFTDYGKGIYSINEMARKASEWGLRNNTKTGGKYVASQVHSMLQNPFYYGTWREPSPQAVIIYKEDPCTAIWVYW
jgi:DNA invertase Pin-like site-specific DNA recombinase